MFRKRKEVRICIHVFVAVLKWGHPVVLSINDNTVLHVDKKTLVAL